MAEKFLKIEEVLTDVMKGILEKVLENKGFCNAKVKKFDSNWITFEFNDKEITMDIDTIFKSEQLKS